MNHRDPSEVLGALTEISEAGVPLLPFSVSHNLSLLQTNAIIESDLLKRVGLKLVGRQPQQWIFSATQWQDLLERVEKAVSIFHIAVLTIKWVSFKLPLTAPILKEATSLLANEKHLGRRGTRFHLPSHAIQVSERDQQPWTRAATRFAPNRGSPLSLRQAAEALGIDKKILETSLKNAVKVGEMVMVAKNRYLPTSYLVRLGCAAEVLAEGTAEGFFTAAEYCEHTKTGRNFAID